MQPSQILGYEVFGQFKANLARACGSSYTRACSTMQSSTWSTYTAEKALDSDEDTFSHSNTVQKDDANNFDGMTPWWKVTFEQEVLVQSVEIVNTDNTHKMSNFNIRVGNVDLYTSLAQNALCKSNLQWVNPTRNTYKCTQAMRGKYLYITNGFNGPVILSDVKVTGYMLPATSHEVIALASGLSHAVALTTPNGITARNIPRRAFVWGSNSMGQIGEPWAVEPTIVPPRRLVRSLFPSVLQGNEINNNNRVFCYNVLNTNQTSEQRYTMKQMQLKTGVLGIKDIQGDINTKMGGEYINIETDQETELVSVQLMKSGVQFDFTSQGCTGLAERLGFSSPLKLPADGLLNEVRTSFEYLVQETVSGEGCEAGTLPHNPCTFCRSAPCGLPLQYFRL
jgi:hypothetical protein